MTPANQAYLSIIDVLPNMLGLFGVMMILMGYFLITREKITPKDLSYHLLNLSGAVLLLISLIWNWNLPSVIIELSWICISFYGIIKVIRNRAHRR